MFTERRFASRRFLILFIPSFAILETFSQLFLENITTGSFAKEYKLFWCNQGLRVVNH